MSMPFYAARKQLSYLRVQLDLWVRLIEAHAETDELGGAIGRRVLYNIRHDGAFGVQGMRDFLGDLLRDDPLAGHWPDSAAAQDAFVDCCHRHQRKGTDRQQPTRLYWHVIPEKNLRAAVNEARGRNPKTNSDIWRRFCEAHDNGDRAAMAAILKGARMHPRGFQVFTTFGDSATVQPAWARPEGWRTTTEACAALGLSTKWTGYRKDDIVWLIAYRLPAPYSCHVPTSADADWRSVFSPSPRRSAESGFTFPLGPVRQQILTGSGGATGMTELVHKAPKMYLITRSTV